MVGRKRSKNTASNVGSSDASGFDVGGFDDFNGDALVDDLDAAGRNRSKNTASNVGDSGASDFNVGGVNGFNDDRLVDDLDGDALVVDLEVVGRNLSRKAASNVGCSDNSVFTFDEIELVTPFDFILLLRVADDFNRSTKDCSFMGATLVGELSSRKGTWAKT